MGPQNARGIGSQLPWKELNMDEKIERIHEVVRNMVQKVGAVEQQVNKTTQNVQDHSHDDRGVAIVKTKLGSNGGYDQELPTPSQPYPFNMSPGIATPPQLDDSEDAYF